MRASRIAAWMHAPWATASSGVTSREGLRPVSSTQHLLDGGHVGRTADEDDLVQLAEPDARLLHDELGRVPGPLQEVRGELLELVPRQVEREALPW